MSRNYSIDFITFCHPGDVHRLYHGTWLSDMIQSHRCEFDNIKVVHQRCGKIALILPDEVVESLKDYSAHVIYSEDHPNILTEFGLPEEDEIADGYTHGPTAPHYWKWHCINHLIGLKVSDADYIVFSDNDCVIRSQSDNQSWIDVGIAILKSYPEILIIGPGDGAVMSEAITPEGYRCTQNVSQQLFLCNRERMLEVDFNIPWNWEVLAPGGPMQEYYYMLEGRIWRYLYKNQLWRCILPDEIARYWHCNLLTEDGLFEADYSKY
jgi:hypothetical protein